MHTLTWQRGSLVKCKGQWKIYQVIYFYYLTERKYLIQNFHFRGTWVAQLVECPTSYQVMISQFVVRALCWALCWRLGAWSLLRIPCLPLLTSPCPTLSHARSLSLLKVNKHKKIKFFSIANFFHKIFEVPYLIFLLTPSLFMISGGRSAEFSAFFICHYKKWHLFKTNHRHPKFLKIMVLFDAFMAV